MTKSSQLMHAAGRRAIEAYATTTKSAVRLAKEIDELPSNGTPIVELHEEDSLVLEIEKVIASSEDALANIAVARTKSQDV